MSFKSFVAGQILTAAEVNTYLMRQSVITCTSGTRPSSPNAGMVIYETDTNRVLVYTTATTGWQPPWNMPWGVMGQAVVSAEQTVANGGVDLTGASVTYTAVAGRRVRISAKALMSNGTLAAGWSLRVYKDGSLYDTVGFNNDTVAAASYGCVGVTIDTPAAGSRTYKLNAFFSVNTDNKVAYSGLNFSTIIIVEDIGPSGAPA